MRERKKLTIFSRRVFLWGYWLFKTSKGLPVLFPVEQTCRRKQRDQTLKNTFALHTSNCFASQNFKVFW